MDTIENNKIIAEFLQMNFNGFSTYEHNGYLLKDKELKFHSDWNWLMEVVEKIESLYYVFAIHNETVNVFNEQNNSQYYNEYFEYKTKIESVYNTCIEFIKWHNEQKK